MSTRKSMTFPVILTFIIIGIVIYLFTTIKQEEVVCEKSKSYDSNIVVNEYVVSKTDGKKITNLYVRKKIILPDKFNNESTINGIKNSLGNTLDYLGDNVKYEVTDYGLLVKISLDEKNVVLLDNISFYDNGDLEIEIDSNIKSSNIVALSVGDNYTEGELMKRLKNNGYSCK